jgi:hypothetical protein
VKALTLTQPWATLVAIGAKRFETRSWRTSHTGPLAIHAAKGVTPIGGQRDFVSLCFTEPFAAVLADAGFNDPLELPRGEVVAIANLRGCYQTSAISASGAPSALMPMVTEGWDGHGRTEWRVEPAEHEREFGDYSLGRFAWALDEVIDLWDGGRWRYPCRGRQQLWELPPEVTLAIDTRLEAERSPA